MTASLVKYVLPVVAVALFGVAVAHVVITGRESNETDSPPAFEPPPTSPFASTVAGAGIVEARTENIAIGSALAGIVKEVFVKVGQKVKAGERLFCLDDRQTLAELAIRQASLESAQAELDRLTHLPRPEEVPVAQAQVREAQANVSEKEGTLYRLRKLVVQKAVTEEELEEAQFSAAAANAALDRARSQLVLLEAGSWVYEKEAAEATVTRARAEVAQIQTDLDRLVVTASVDGEILQVNVRPGEFVGAPPGEPLIVLGNTEKLHIRVDIDENDIPRYCPGANAVANLKGNPQFRFPLTFVRVEPFVVPKISLTGENTERIDTRVLQVIYRVATDNGPRLYVGQQVDVFLDAGETPQ